MTKLQERRVYRVGVIVARCVPKWQLHPEDYSVADYYEIDVEAASAADASERALDEFHECVPIKCLDDFEIDTDVFLL